MGGEDIHPGCARRTAQISAAAVRAFIAVKNDEDVKLCLSFQEAVVSQSSWGMQAQEVLASEVPERQHFSACTAYNFTVIQRKEILITRVYEHIGNPWSTQARPRLDERIGKWALKTMKGPIAGFTKARPRGRWKATSPSLPFQPNMKRCCSWVPGEGLCGLGGTCWHAGQGARCHELSQL